MKFISALLIAVAFAACAVTASAETTFNGSLAGAFVFNPDGTASGLAPGLGIVYRPDAELTPTGKIAFSPSKLVFGTTQWFRDGSPDYNILFGGYSLRHWPNFEVIGEGGCVFKNVAENRFGIGAVGQIECLFTALGQPMSFKAGGGTDGTNPILILSLGFTTQ